MVILSDFPTPSIHSRLGVHLCWNLFKLSSIDTWNFMGCFWLVWLQLTYSSWSVYYKAVPLVSYCKLLLAMVTISFLIENSSLYLPRHRNSNLHNGPRNYNFYWLSSQTWKHSLWLSSANALATRRNGSYVSSWTAYHIHSYNNGPSRCNFYWLPS